MCDVLCKLSSFSGLIVESAGVPDLSWLWRSIQGQSFQNDYENATT